MSKVVGFSTGSSNEYSGLIPLLSWNKKNKTSLFYMNEIYWNFQLVWIFLKHLNCFMFQMK